MGCRKHTTINRYQTNAMDVNEHTFYGVNPGSAAMVVYADDEGFVTCACGELILVAPASFTLKSLSEKLEDITKSLQALNIDPETLVLLRNLSGLRTASTEEKRDA